MNAFMKLRCFKDLVGVEVGTLEHAELKGVVEKLTNRWHGKSNRKVKLTKQEVAIYELLLENQLRPSTVYRWFLIAEAPAETRLAVSSGKLSIREALKQKRELKAILQPTEDDLLADIKDCIGRYILR